MENKQKVKFSHTYELLKDTPKYKKGWKLRWSGGNEKFYFYKKSTWGYNKGEPDIYLDLESTGFTLEEIQDTEWFKPTGELVDYIPSFPNKKDLKEYMYLLPETRLVDDVDICRAINRMLNNTKFQDQLYEFYKQKYEEFYEQR